MGMYYQAQFNSAGDQTQDFLQLDKHSADLHPQPIKHHFYHTLAHRGRQKGLPNQGQGTGYGPTFLWVEYPGYILRRPHGTEDVVVIYLSNTIYHAVLSLCFLVLLLSPHSYSHCLCCRTTCE